MDAVRARGLFAVFDGLIESVPPRHAPANGGSAGEDAERAVEWAVNAIARPASTGGQWKPKRKSSGPGHDTHPAAPGSRPGRRVEGRQQGREYSATLACRGLPVPPGVVILATETDGGIEAAVAEALAVLGDDAGALLRAGGGSRWRLFRGPVRDRARRPWRRRRPRAVRRVRETANDARVAAR